MNKRALILPILALAALLPISAGAGLRAAEGTISGKVMNEDGTPAASVQVRVMSPGARGGKKQDKAAQPAEGKRAKPAAQTTTGADGSFTANVPPGEYVVQAGKRGEGMGRSEKITVTEGKTTSVEIKLKKMEGGAAPSTPAPK